MHIFRLLLFLCISLHCASSAFAADEIWDADPTPFTFDQNWKRLQGCPQDIDMKPTQLLPESKYSSALRPTLTRFLGPILKGVSGTVGVVLAVNDLENGRQAVAYAIDQLMKNGQPVTPQTIHEWIAQQNGIDTSGAPAPGLQPDGSVIFEGLQHSVVLQSGGATGYNLSVGWSQPSWSSPMYLVYYDGNYSPFTGRSYSLYRIISSSPAPTGFDPANYPDLFGPDVYTSNALDALIVQGLDTFDLSLTQTNGNLDDALLINADAIKEANANTEWTEVYSNGHTYKIPIGALGGYELPKYANPLKSVNVETAKGTTTLSNADSSPFTDAGISPGSTIIKVDPETGSITYKDPSGVTRLAQVSKSTASNLTNTHNVYNTVTNSTTNTHITERLSVELPDVSVSGSINAKEGSLEPVEAARISTSKQRFLDAWNNLKVSVEGLFTVNLSGTGQFPIWHWLVLGKTVTIDFNQFDTQLNWLSLAFVFFSTLGALFLVFGK